MELNSIISDRKIEMLRTAFGDILMDYLYNDLIVEIMVNPDGRLHYEEIGKGKNRTNIYFPPEKTENIVKLVSSIKNGVANDCFPEVASELPFGGARFQGWLSPVVEQACFSIRRKASKIFTLNDYLNQGVISTRQRKILIDAVECRKNIVIVGGTGSGKTTFANSLLDVLKGSDDRIIVIEDLPELQVNVDDLVTMTTTDSVSMAKLVKGSLRMRPDRIVIGEVRDGSALDLLKAWNTGHPGGVCTIHANSVNSAPYRFEDLIQEAVVKVPKNLILQAIDLIVFIEKDKTGKRTVKDIAELAGYESNNYIINSII